MSVRLRRRLAQQSATGSVRYSYNTDSSNSFIVSVTKTNHQMRNIFTTQYNGGPYMPIYTHTYLDTHKHRHTHTKLVFFSYFFAVKTYSL